MKVRPIEPVEKGQTWAAQGLCSYCKVAALAVSFMENGAKVILTGVGLIVPLALAIDWMKGADGITIALNVVRLVPPVCVMGMAISACREVREMTEKGLDFSR